MTVVKSPSAVLNDNEAIGLLTVAGTGGWHNDNARDDWWKVGSSFVAEAAAHGFVLLDPNDPFVWTTDLNGMQFWRRWAIWKRANRQPADHGDWIAGGAAARYYVDAKNYRHNPAVADDSGHFGFIAFPRHWALVVWTHSFGGCVGFYAAEQGLEIDVLVTTGMPVRKDMRFVYEEAETRIGTWVHFQSKTADRTASAGMFGDGRFGFKRQYFPTEPDVILVEPDVDHSKILHERVTTWHDRGWLELIRRKAIENKCQRLSRSSSQQG